MLFWITAAALACATGFVVLRPLLNEEPAEAGESPDMALYRAQLQDIERDLARGVLSASEAEATRVEVSRRLLAADKARPAALTGAPEAATRLAIAAGWLLVALGGVGVYLGLGAPLYPDAPRMARLAASVEAIETRLSQAEAEAEAPALPVPEQDPAYVELVENLRRVVKERPDDLRGYEFLVRSESNLGNFSAAAEAQAKVVEMKETPEIKDLELLLDLMVYAAGGYVSQEAVELTERVLAADARSVPGRFYKGLLYQQVDRPDLAFAQWEGVMQEAPGSAHAAMIAPRIEQVAGLAGIPYEPPMDDQSAMIEGMVEGLAARLASEGGTPEEWARLVQSLGVLGQTERAAVIWGEAQGRFSGEALELIRAAAQTAGVE